MAQYTNEERNKEKINMPNDLFSKTLKYSRPPHKHLQKQRRTSHLDPDQLAKKGR